MQNIGRRVIGVVEPVTMRGTLGEMSVHAKIDTGASRTTVDTVIAAHAGLGPLLGTAGIRQSIRWTSWEKRSSSSTHRWAPNKGKGGGDERAALNL